MLALDFRGHGDSEGLADGPMEQDVLAAVRILRQMPDVDPEAKPKVMHRIKVEIPDLPSGVTVSHRKFYYPNPVPQGPAGSQ